MYTSSTNVNIEVRTHVICLGQGYRRFALLDFPGLIVVDEKCLLGTIAKVQSKHKLKQLTKSETDQQRWVTWSPTLPKHF